MSEELQMAFIILLVGMTTVFSILSLVVLTGNILIRIVNQFFPAPIAPLITSETSASAKIPTSTNFSKSKLAAIVAAVDILTEGKGKVEKITKKN